MLLTHCAGPLTWGSTQAAAAHPRTEGCSGAELTGSHEGRAAASTARPAACAPCAVRERPRTTPAIPRQHVLQVGRPPDGDGSPARPVCAESRPALCPHSDPPGTRPARMGLKRRLKAGTCRGTPTDARGRFGSSQRSFPALKQRVTCNCCFLGTPFLGNRRRRRGSPVRLPLPPGPAPPARTSRRSPARCTTTARFCPGAAMARFGSRVQGPTAEPLLAAGPPSAPGRPGAAPQAPLPQAPPRPAAARPTAGQPRSAFPVPAEPRTADCGLRAPSLLGALSSLRAPSPLFAQFSVNTAESAAQCGEQEAGLGPCSHTASAHGFPAARWAPGEKLEISDPRGGGGVFCLRSFAGRAG